MTIKEAIKQRHMVRKYTDKPIPADLVELLNARIAENNAAHGLNLKLVIGNSDGIGEASGNQGCPHQWRNRHRLWSDPGGTA